MNDLVVSTARLQPHVSERGCHPIYRRQHTHLFVLEARDPA